MRHRIRGRQLSRDTEHRKALRRNLVQSLFEHGKVRTTLPKAQEVRAFAERLITLAKTAVAGKDRGDEDGKRVALDCRRRVIAALQDRRLVDKEQEFITEGARTVIEKLFDEIAPQFSDRTGGYTRIIKLSDYRIGDGGSLVLLQLLTEKSAPRGSARRSAGLRRKRYERRQTFAANFQKQRRSAAKQTAAAEQSEPAPSDATPASE
jgi:large subunit ribosomal protein L17